MILLLYLSVITSVVLTSPPERVEIFWDGEWDSSFDAQSSLLIGVPVTLVLMLIIIMLLYNSIKVIKRD